MSGSDSNAGESEQSATPRKDGVAFKHRTDEVACPQCDVVQKRQVMAQPYLNVPTSYYIDETCPVCGFDGVWY